MHGQEGVEPLIAPAPSAASGVAAPPVVQDESLSTWQKAVGYDDSRPTPIDGLPGNILSIILLTASPSDNLLRRVSLCARVHPNWRRVVMDCHAFGRGIAVAPSTLFRDMSALAQIPGPRLANNDSFIARVVVAHGRLVPLTWAPGDGPELQSSADVSERSRVMTLIDKALGECWRHDESEDEEEDEEEDENQDSPFYSSYAQWKGTLSLSHAQIGDAGAQCLAAALHAATPLRIGSLGLQGCILSAKGLEPVLLAIEHIRVAETSLGAPQGLRTVLVSDNPLMGDMGIIALARSLPSTVTYLSFSATNCGDTGMVAMASALPRTEMIKLECTNNPAIGLEGWAALGTALTKLETLLQLGLRGCQGMGCAGVAALAFGLTEVPELRDLDLYYCGVQLDGVRALAAVLPVLSELESLSVCHDRIAVRLLKRAAHSTHVIHVDRHLIG